MTDQTKAIVEQVDREAWDLLCRRLQRDPATSEEDETCTLRAAWKAMVAHRRTATTAENEALKARVAALEAALGLAAEQFKSIREANDPDDPSSYRSEDHEDCLDWTFAMADESEKSARHYLQEGN